MLIKRHNGLLIQFCLIRFAACRSGGAPKIDNLPDSLGRKNGIIAKRLPNGIALLDLVVEYGCGSFRKACALGSQKSIHLLAERNRCRGVVHLLQRCCKAFARFVDGASDWTNQTKN